MATFSIPLPRLCLDCSADISRRGNQSFCCVACAEVRSRLRQQCYYQQAKGTPEYKARRQEYMLAYRQTPIGKRL